MARNRPNFPERYAEYLRSYPRWEPTPQHVDFDSIGSLDFDHGERFEKFIMYRTDILRHYPFPELKHTAFIPEGYVCYQYPGKVRCINEAVRIYFDSSNDNLTHSKWRKAWRGMLFYYVWLLTHRPRYFWLSVKAKACRVLGGRRGSAPRKTDSAPNP